MRVCLGGTFDPFHVGHEALLRAAADGADEVFVGVTDGPLATRPERGVAPVAERIAVVEDYLQSRVAATVRPLRDPLGPAASEPFDRIVVSEGTMAGAARINAARQERRLPLLDVVVVPFERGEDRLPISATAVAAKLIDRAGRRLRPVRVAVGSANPVKVAAAAAAFGDFLPAPAQVEGVDVSSGVPEQPRGDETLRGARQRAQRAMAARGADYAVGIEAGLHSDGEGWFDVQACVIVDRTGAQTRGWGPAFQYPQWVTERALAGEMVSAILGPVVDDPRIGGTIGAIGYLSEGTMDRTRLSRIAVEMALIPRRQAVRPAVA